MPPPSIDYLLDEAARFRGYTQGVWNQEDWRDKARVLAHFLEHQLREGYAMDQAEKRAKRETDKKRGQAPPDYFRYRQGKGP